MIFLKKKKTKHVSTVFSLRFETLIIWTILQLAAYAVLTWPIFLGSKADLKNAWPYHPCCSAHSYNSLLLLCWYSCSRTALCLTTMLKTLASTWCCCFNPLFHGPILKHHPTLCWADTKERSKMGKWCWKCLLPLKKTEVSLKGRRKCYCCMVSISPFGYVNVRWFLIWGTPWSFLLIQRCCWLTLLCCASPCHSQILSARVAPFFAYNWD